MASIGFEKTLKVEKIKEKNNKIYLYISLFYTFFFSHIDLIIKEGFFISSCMQFHFKLF